MAAIWPPMVYREAARLRGILNCTEKESNGLWNIILMEFVDHDYYMTHPQQSVPKSQKLMDFVINYSNLPDGVKADEYGFHPAHAYTTMFVENKPGRAIGNVSTREYADDQMRERFELLRTWQTRPLIYGISAIGTQFAVYHMDISGNIHPQSIPRTIRVTDTAPARWWAYDIMTVQGRAKLEQVLGHIEAMCRGERWSDPAIV